MIRLVNAETGEPLGSITEAQLQFLVDQMEEEFMEDQDYAITPMTLTYFEGLNADPHLLDLLKQGLGGRDEANIRWSRE